MYRELFALINVISIICISIVLSQIILFQMLLGFLLIVSIGMIIFSVMFINYQLTKTEGYKWIEKPPPGYELIPLVTLTGLMDLVWAKKKPDGKREFVYNQQEASIINRGDYPLHFRSGAHGCLGHESHDESINLMEVKAAEKFTKVLGTNDLKEMYNKIDHMEVEQQ